MLTKEITGQVFKILSFTFIEKIGAEKSPEEMFSYYCLTKNGQLIKRRCRENKNTQSPTSAISIRYQKNPLYFCVTRQHILKYNRVHFQSSKPISPSRSCWLYTGHTATFEVNLWQHIPREDQRCQLILVLRCGLSCGKPHSNKIHFQKIKKVKATSIFLSQSTIPFCALGEVSSGKRRKLYF